MMAVALTLAMLGQSPLVPNTVCVISKNRTATGFICANGLVMTAKHAYHKKTYCAPDCVPFDKNVEMARQVAYSKELDVTVITAPVEGSVEFASPVLDEEVYIDTFSHSTRSFFRGRVCMVGEHFSWVDTHILLGASGSAVYNKEGKVVGLVVAILTDYSFVTVIVNGEYLERIRDVAVEALEEVCVSE